MKIYFRFSRYETVLWYAGDYDSDTLASFDTGPYELRRPANKCVADHVWSSRHYWAGSLWRTEMIVETS